MERGDDEAMFIDYDFPEGFGVWYAANRGHWFWDRPYMYAVVKSAFDTGCTFISDDATREER
jgi:hypothetical protein